jgi:hypothetical protein
MNDEEKELLAFRIYRKNGGTMECFADLGKVLQGFYLTMAEVFTALREEDAATSSAFA